MGGTNDNYPTTVCHLWSKMGQNWENRLKDFLLTGKKMGCSIAKCFYTCHVTRVQILAISPVKQHHFDLIHQVRRWVSAFFLALVLFSHCEIRRSSRFWSLDPWSVVRLYRKIVIGTGSKCSIDNIKCNIFSEIWFEMSQIDQNLSQK